MKMSSGLLCLLIALGGLASATWAGQLHGDRKDGDYIIGCGDVLNIVVWKDEALSRQITVLPDGKFNYPLIGEIKASGRTVSDIKTEMEGLISRYAPSPTISVEVFRVNSMNVYVVGRVNRPGKFEMNEPMDILQALSMAGGLNSFAEEDEIKIFRKVEGKITIFQFDYSEVVDGENLEQNIMLQRGDVIVVP